MIYLNRSAIKLANAKERQMNKPNQNSRIESLLDMLDTMDEISIDEVHRNDDVCEIL